MKFITVQKGTGKQKQVPMYHSTSGRKSTKTSEDANLFEMKMIADQFGDGWHKCITDLFAGQRIEALFGNRWH